MLLGLYLELIIWTKSVFWSTIQVSSAGSWFCSCVVFNHFHLWKVEWETDPLPSIFLGVAITNLLVMCLFSPATDLINFQPSVRRLLHGSSNWWKPQKTWARAKLKDSGTPLVVHVSSLEVMAKSRGITYHWIIWYNVGIAIINHQFWMVYTTHFWWLGGWFVIAIPTLYDLRAYDCKWYTGHPILEINTFELHRSHFSRCASLQLRSSGQQEREEMIASVNRE